MTAVPAPRRSFLQRVRWCLPFFASLLPIVLLSVYSYNASSDSVEQLVQRSNVSAAGNLAELLTQDFNRSIHLARAIASLPGTVEAARVQDEITIGKRLKAIVISYPEIDRAYITDRKGVLWADFPAMLGTFGKSFARSDWFREVTRHWLPAISAVHPNGGGTSTSTEVAIAMPINDETGQPVSILVFEVNLSHLSESQKIRPSRAGQTYVLDHEGSVVVHPLLPTDKIHRPYARVPEVQEALRGKLYTGQYRDPLLSEEMIATFLPVSMGRHLWVVVAQQPMGEAYAKLRGLKVSLSLGGSFLTFLTFTLILFLARVSARNERLNRELQEKNQQLREVASIVESSYDAIIGQDLNGVIKTWNAGAEKIYGYRENEVKGKPIAMLVAPKRAAEVRRILKKIRAGRTVKHVETIHVRKDRRLFHVSLTISPVKDVSGHIVGASAIARDITERKQIEQMRSDFISIVSHQLKAPVTAIRWTIESLLEGLYGKVSGKVKSALQEMHNVNTKSYKLISDILNVSRIQRGVISVSLAPVSLMEVSKAAAQNYRPTFQEKGLELRLEEKTKGIVVLADREKLAEAVGNSIGNALKHTKQGSITVRVYRNGGYGYVEVVDTGEGMSRETLKRLFTRDQILGGSASSESSAGLGLYIAKSFMKLQHGDVWAESERGKGSTFVYKVPLAVSKARQGRAVSKVRKGSRGD